MLKGRFYLSPVVTQGLLGLAKDGFGGPRVSPGPPPPVTRDALTPREAEILRLLGTGLCNKEIAHQLGVSVTTVRTHLNRIYEKVGPMSRVELALYAAICPAVRCDGKRLPREPGPASFFAFCCKTRFF